MSKSILIWDQVEHRVPEFSGSVYLWKEYSENISINQFSIPKYIDQNRFRLRDKYNSLLYEFAKIRIKNKRIVDWLEIRPNFSFWWMTLIVESNYGKSTFMASVIKLLALEEILDHKKVSEIFLNSSDSNIQKVIHKFCKENRIQFFSFSEKNSKIDNGQGDLRRGYNSLPYFLKASITFLRYINLVWGLRKQKVPREKMQDSDFIIFDYFFHLRLDSKNPKLFRSNYWTDLIDVLRKTKIRTFWSHIFVRHSLIPNSQEGVSLLKSFNQNETEIHSFLEGYIDFIVLLKTFLDYLRINCIQLFIRNFRFFCRTKILSFDLWPVLRSDFLDSLSGSMSVQNLFLFNLIEKNLKNISGPKKGIYLQENQAWESALIYIWKSKNIGPLIGVPHSTVRFWDLRYFSDYRNYDSNCKNSMPLPDKVALNGNASLNAYKEGRYPQDRIAEVEALRYLEIEKDVANIKKDKKRNTSNVKVLILTDYLPKVTRLQLRMLMDALQLLNLKFEFILKPHPACPVYEKEFPFLQFKVFQEPIVNLIQDADIVYTSNITSAAVDAYCFGIPVISVLDGSSLNMSPLLGMDHVTFVSTHQELSKALQKDFGISVKERKAFFYLDPNLTKWKKLLRIE
ncbi:MULTISPECIES: TIGR04326 family surface carbohydrate biosynthesis protein [Leptospira]|uniref:TIGR04326 family surface carbohydrate biosynthesis protein n=1 Tax=Leptospira TaxID=171 RepID=UPI0002BFDF48|nr:MULTISPECIES: TIGR04326 family surface carbohydrate biosynthesis protein [Leptospira]EMK04010.1 surface carbohydrate biosynthesis protein, TIGR04326 family [Leptospira kirschneri]KXZ27027.1 carbohydrate biosynthesis protein [Leptospira kirschneri]KXZ34369.1 carbohydrate biosynthesis protein [Leptospira sp. ZV016]